MLRTNLDSDWNRRSYVCNSCNRLNGNTIFFFKVNYLRFLLVTSLVLKLSSYFTCFLW
jgi:hypothetical protein